ncbi:MAG: beta-hydroxyacyl-ACP dehydratase [Pirellulales bacterium]|nr:beta-hydroxyacyl-ACP dehydratase [Pirellulales bacterium]
MTLEAIKAAIPHREPFLLIDRVVQQTGDSIQCEKTFSGDEFWYRGHYPDYPLTPGVLLCEACMQAGAVLLSEQVDGDDRVPVATRLNDVKFKRQVRPGETISINVKIDERLADAFFLTGKVTCDGKLAARLSFACAMAPRTE